MRFLRIALNSGKQGPIMALRPELTYLHRPPLSLSLSLRYILEESGRGGGVGTPG